MRAVTEHRNLISFALASCLGLLLRQWYPFDSGHPLLQLVLLQKPHLFFALEYSYRVMLFTTPFIAFSVLLSFTYIFRSTERAIVLGKLPPYPDAQARKSLYVIVGEVHHPKKPEPAEAPCWLTIPERGLFTGIAVFGAIGSGKTTTCMVPFAEQILAYCGKDPQRRASALVLEVKATSAIRSSTS